MFKSQSLDLDLAQFEAFCRSIMYNTGECYHRWFSGVDVMFFHAFWRKFCVDVAFGSPFVSSRQPEEYGGQAGALFGFQLQERQCFHPSNEILDGVFLELFCVEKKLDGPCTATVRLV